MFRSYEAVGKLKGQLGKLPGDQNYEIFYSYAYFRQHGSSHPEAVRKIAKHYPEVGRKAISQAVSRAKESPFMRLLKDWPGQ